MKARRFNAGKCMVPALLALGLCLVSCTREEQIALADGTVSVSTWEGKWLVVNYFAEWCAPCREEIPELNALNVAAGSGHVPDLIVYGVNFDGITGAPLLELMNKMGVEFPVFETDPRMRWNYALPSILPTTVLIDPKGEVSEVLVGPQTLESIVAHMQPTTTL